MICGGDHLTKDHDKVTRPGAAGRGRPNPSTVSPGGSPRLKRAKHQINYAACYMAMPVGGFRVPKKPVQPRLTCEHGNCGRRCRILCACGTRTCRSCWESHRCPREVKKVQTQFDSGPDGDDEFELVEDESEDEYDLVEDEDPVNNDVDQVEESKRLLEQVLESKRRWPTTTPSELSAMEREGRRELAIEEAIANGNVTFEASPRSYLGEDSERRYMVNQHLTPERRRSPPPESVDTPIKDRKLQLSCVSCGRGVGDADQYPEGYVCPECPAGRTDGCLCAPFHWTENVMEEMRRECPVHGEPESAIHVNMRRETESSSSAESDSAIQWGVLKSIALTAKPEEVLPQTRNPESSKSSDPPS